MEAVMPQYLRVAPADVEEVRRRFHDDVVPVFTRHAGCLGLELTVNVAPNAGGLVEGAAISRWASLDEMASAMAAEDVQDAIARIRGLLRQEPVAKVLEVLT
jgi:quinol monooxygenase YgiN